MDSHAPRKITHNPVQRQYPLCMKKPSMEEEETLQVKEAAGQAPEVTPEMENIVFCGE